MGMVVSYFGTNGPINPAPVTPFSNVVLLVGFESDNGSGFFVNDESSYDHADTFGTTGPGFLIQSTTKKFGTNSVFRGSIDKNSSLAYADSAQFAFGANPFTIECWVNFSVAPTTGRHYLVDQYTDDTAIEATGRSWALLVNAGALQLRVSSDGTTETVKASAAWSPSTGTWYHVAGDFDGTTYRTYVNGALMASSTGAVTLHNPSTGPQIARKRSNGTDWSNFEGYIDEVRVCKVAAYASDTGFTAPTAAFPRS